MNIAEICDEAAALACDTPGTGMLAPEVLTPAVDALAALAGRSRALEFGTGRAALPLRDRGRG